MTSTPNGFKLHTKGHNFADIYLEEGLDLGPLLNLLLGHTFCHNAGVPIDTGNQSMAKRFVRGTFIVGLYNNCLATSKSAGQYKDNLALFHNLAHFGVEQIFLVTPI